MRPAWEEPPGFTGEVWRAHVRTDNVSYEEDLRWSYLIENKHFIVPHRIQGVPIGGFGSVLSLCVSRKSKHVHFHVHAHLFVCQELA